MRKIIIYSTVLLFTFSLGIGSAFGLSNIDRLEVTAENAIS
jgi:hypothetical protein